LKQNEFQNMWETMQREGYFREHPHYSDHFGITPDKQELELDAAITSLDFSADDITMPIPYSDELERSVKRTESTWLYRMFDLPRSGCAYDIGCGFGRSLIWMTEIYDQVIGSDISPTVIQQAQDNLKDADNLTLYANSADALPSGITQKSIDVAYIFTVFQHIPREYACQLLIQLQPLLKESGKVVFNLLTNINEELNTGEINTEWAIGYSHEQANAMVQDAGLSLLRMTTWSRPETDVQWLWVLASNNKEN